MAASRNNVRLMHGAPKRLSEIIRRGACDVRTPPSLDPIKRLLGIEPISKEVLKREWATVAKHALSVREDEYLKNTFAFFGLDPDDPGDWRIWRPTGRMCFLGVQNPAAESSGRTRDTGN